MDYLITFIVVHLIIGRHDATKEQSKKVDGTYEPFYEHEGYNWHLVTTAMWVSLFCLIAYLTRDWKYLLLNIGFFQLDLNYYLWEKVINPASYFMPERMDWFIAPHYLFGIQINPMRWIHKEKFTVYNFGV